MTKVAGRLSPTVRKLVLAATMLMPTILGVALALSVTGDAANLVIVAVAVGLVSGVALMGLAIYRFDWFLYTLLAARPLMDGLSLGDQGSAEGLFSPTTMIGLAFVISSVVWLARRIVGNRSVPLSSLSWSLIGLVLAAGASVLVSPQVMMSAAATMRLAASALMFIALEQALASGVVTVRRILTSVFVSAALVGVWSLFQLATGGGMFDEDTGLMRITGPFVHPNVAAKYHLVVVVTLLALLLWGRVRERHRVWLVLAIGVVLIQIAFSYTRVVWLTALLAAMYLVAKKDFRFVPPAMGAALLAIVLVPSLFDRVSELWNPPAPTPGVPDNSLVWRIGYWKNLLPLALASPINGRGLDTTRILSPDRLAPHNVVVQVIVELGVVGLIALVAVVWSMVSNLRTASKAAADPSVSPLTPGAIAIATTLGVMLWSENLLNETTTLWYAAAIITCGYVPAIRRVPGSAVPSVDEGSGGRHRLPGTG